MKLREMVNHLRRPQNIEIRNCENRTICYCGTHSEGAIPYLDKEVSEWFAGHAPGDNWVDFVVNLEQEKQNGN